MPAKARTITISGNYNQGKKVMILVDTVCETYATTLSTDTTSDVIENLWDSLRNWREQLVNARGIRGFNKFAKDEEDESDYDARAEWKKVIDAIKLATDWISDNVVFRANPARNGDKTYNSYTAIELAPLLPLLQAIRNEIE